jgi:hypothetical protein
MKILVIHNGNDTQDKGKVLNYWTESRNYTATQPCYTNILLTHVIQNLGYSHDFTYFIFQKSDAKRIVDGLP